MIGERIIPPQISSPIVKHNKTHEAMGTYIIGKLNYRTQNKSLKPTVTHVTPFAKKAKPAPRYGGLVPPFCSL